MNHTKKKHRHWVCLPIVAGVLLMSSLGNSSSMFASVLATPPVTQLGDADMAHVFTSGEHTIQVNGLQSFAVGSYSATALDGLVYIAIGSTKLTVAAVSASVELADTNGATVLIPAGYQWSTTQAVLPATTLPAVAQYRAKKLQRIPAKFIRAQKNMSNVSVIASEIRTPTSVPLALEPLLVTKRAKSAVALATFTEQLKQLQQASAVQNAALQSVLVSQIVQTPLNKNTTNEVLAWLNNAVLPLAVRTTMLQHLWEADSTLRTLSAVHPLYADTIWGTLQAELLPVEEFEVYTRYPLLFFEHSGSMIALQAWQSSMKEALLLRPVVRLPIVLHVGTELSTSTAQQLHPYTSSVLAQALIELISPHVTQLSKAELVQLDTIRQVVRTPLPTLDTMEEATADEVELDDSYVGILSASESEALARQILREAGAIFTLTTQLTPAGINTVHVENIVFGGQTTDRVVTFDLQVKRGEVLNIQEQQKVYPNPMWIEDFVAWIKR